MKKIILVCAIAVLMFACKSTSATSTKTDRKSQVAIKGDWVISSVTYPGSQYVKVNSFQLADSECFVGSSWKFVSNNNKGTMALTKANCVAFSSPITWFVNNEGQFVLKVLDAGEKARKVRDGYILGLANQTETSFQLVDKIDVAGKMTDVIYQFQKTN
ncbi:lipocalin family protein [Flavobacterium tiangeerense]|uniref:lipocalin family protein n=1 Tax=Flavobacterium tiangeerense TaxID=459471 RepID=UPI00119FF678|nr:lipocalin family protein [Flavobacterium tiangeerense]